MRLKNSCPVWGEGAGKVPDGNSPTPYSTARPVLRGLGNGNVPQLPDDRYMANLEKMEANRSEH